MGLIHEFKLALIDTVPIIAAVLLTIAVVGGLFYALMWLLVNIQAMAGGM